MKQKMTQKRMMKQKGYRRMQHVGDHWQPRPSQTFDWWTHDVEVAVVLVEPRSGLGWGVWARRLPPGPPPPEQPQRQRQRQQERERQQQTQRV